MVNTRDASIETVADTIVGSKANFAFESVDDMEILINEFVEVIIGALERERERCATLAYNRPVYVMNGMLTDEEGVLLPGSPYDRGRYDARKAIMLGEA